MSHKYFDLVRGDIEQEMLQGNHSVGMIKDFHDRQPIWTRNPSDERLKQIRMFVTNNNKTLRSLH